eukprot:scaffold22608_cov66-Phaeocystis_antarctica.AAC.2
MPGTAAASGRLEKNSSLSPSLPYSSLSSSSAAFFISTTPESRSSRGRHKHQSAPQSRWAALDERREGRLGLGSEAVDEVKQLGLVAVVEGRGVSSCRRPGPQELAPGNVVILGARLNFIVPAEGRWLKVRAEVVHPCVLPYGLLLELGQLNDQVQHVADSRNVRLHPHERCRQTVRHVGKLIRLDEEREAVFSVLITHTAVQVEKGGGALEWSAGKASDDIADLLRTAGQLQQRCRSSRQANDRADLQSSLFSSKRIVQSCASCCGIHSARLRLRRMACASGRHVVELLEVRSKPEASQS